MHLASTLDVHQFFPIKGKNFYQVVSFQISWRYQNVASDPSSWSVEGGSGYQTSYQGDGLTNENTDL